jgi:hypothetical protein
MKSLKDIYEEEFEDSLRQYNWDDSKWLETEAAKRRNRTDKPRSHYDLYESLFSPYRASASTIFEIGVLQGGSIRIWEKYFPSATIFGLDNNDRRLSYLDNLSYRVKAIKLDQEHKSELRSFGQTYGPFDIGIDDGSHIWAHQIQTFEILWPFIKPGGLFVIEDVFTSYYEWINNSKLAVKLGIQYDQGGKSCVEYFKELVDELNFYGEDSVPEEKHTEFQKTIESLVFSRNLIILKKKGQVR